MSSRLLNWLNSGSGRGAEDVEKIFSGRPALTDDAFFDRYFTGCDVNKAVAIGVRAAFVNRLPFDMGRLAPDDSFKSELNFVWGYDSLADVEVICEIEKRFNVKISDVEARGAATLGDMIHLVNKKVVSQSA
jgi:acyl carrier protein